MTREDAAMLTEEIKRTTDRLWELLERAHHQRVWEALGYRSWKDYVEQELGMSQRRSFQLVGQAQVIHAFESVLPIARDGEPRFTPRPPLEISERQARRIKPHLSDAINRTKELLADGVEPEAAVTQAIQETEEIIQQAAKIAYDDPLLQLVPILEATEKMRQIRGVEDVAEKIAEIHGWDQVRYYARRLTEDMDYLVELKEILQGRLARRV